MTCAAAVSRGVERAQARNPFLVGEQAETASHHKTTSGPRAEDTIAGSTTNQSVKE